MSSDYRAPNNVRRVEIMLYEGAKLSAGSRPEDPSVLSFTGSPSKRELGDCIIGYVIKQDSGGFTLSNGINSDGRPAGHFVHVESSAILYCTDLSLVVSADLHVLR